MLYSNSTLACIAMQTHVQPLQVAMRLALVMRTVTIIAIDCIVCILKNAASGKHNSMSKAETKEEIRKSQCKRRSIDMKNARKALEACIQCIARKS